MSETYDNDNTAVIVVDMQNDFCHPDGNLYAPPSEEAVQPVAELVETATNANVPVVYTRDIHPDEQFEENSYYNEFDRWGEHVVEGSWGAELIDDLPTEDAAHIVDKHTYNAFHQTDLEGWLEAHNIENLIICGTLANVCVLHTASGAGLRDFKPVVVTDALGFIEQDHKDYAVEHADWLFGETTTRSELDFE